MKETLGNHFEIEEIGGDATSDTVEQHDSSKNKETLEIPDIESLSMNEYISFLETVETHPARHDIAQKDIDTIMERGLQILEEQDADFMVANQIYSALGLCGDYQTGNPEQPESISDKAFRALARLYKKYPNAGHEIENLFGQNREVQPEVLISVTADACGDPETDPYFLQDLVQSFKYILSFGGDAYDEVILKEIDFKNSDNFFRTGRFLELLKTVINVSSSQNFSEHLVKKLSDLLARTVENKEGNYLLTIRVQKILSDLGMYGYARTSPRAKTSYQKIDDELLLNPKLNKTEEEKLMDKEDLIDFHYLMESSVKDIVESEFQIELDSLSHQEKFYFLKLIKQKNQVEMERVKKFTKTFKEAGFKSFLSVDYGPDMGEKVLQIGEHAEEPVAQQIFGVYADLVSGADTVEKLLNDAYGRQEHGDEVIKIKDAILKKGKDLLERYANMLMHNSSVSSEEILADLQRIETQATIFFLTFKTLKQSKQLPSLEDIKGISFDEKPADQLSFEEVNDMRKIYAGNYADDPDLLSELLSKFEERIVDGQSKFYTLKYRGKMKGFIGFTPIGDSDTLYFHSVNVEDSLRGISIGNTMMEKALDTEAKEYVLEADCAAFKPIGAKYVEDGCVGIHFYMFKNSPSLHVVRDEKTTTTIGENL